jgi:antitoxin component YwqK of YwqJK toxin-antitoxin module
MRSFAVILLLFFSSLLEAQNRINTIKCWQYIAYGKVANGKKEGHWNYIHPRSRALYFSGNYHHDLKTGEWKFYSEYYYGNSEPAKSIIVHYKNNILDGLVTYFDQNTKYIEGRFANGLKEGKWIYYSNKKEYAIRFFKDGMPSGKWKEGSNIEDPNNPGIYGNDYWTGEMSAAGREGKWVQVRNDSVIGGGLYIHGKREGHWIEQLSTIAFEEGDYKDGLREGCFTVQFTNGNKSSVTCYHNDLKEGIDSSWYEGSLYVSHYHADILSGLYEEFYPNKRPASIGNFIANPNSIPEPIYRKTKASVSIPELMIIDLLENDICDFNRFRFTEDLNFSPAYRDSIIPLIKTLPSYDEKIDTHAYYLWSDSNYIWQEAKTGYWKYFYPNGNVKEDGSYLPSVKTSYEDSTSQMEDPNNPGTFTIGPSPLYLKTGTWHYYNEQGVMIREERYNETGDLIETKISGK